MMDATAEVLRRRARDLVDFLLEDDLRAFPLAAFLCFFTRDFVFVFLALRAVDFRRVVLRFVADLRFVAVFFLFSIFSPK